MTPVFGSSGDSSYSHSSSPSTVPFSLLAGCSESAESTSRITTPEMFANNSMAPSADSFNLAIFCNEMFKNLDRPKIEVVASELFKRLIPNRNSSCTLESECLSRSPSKGITHDRKDKSTSNQVDDHTKKIEKDLAIANEDLKAAKSKLAATDEKLAVANEKLTVAHEIISGLQTTKAVTEAKLEKEIKYRRDAEDISAQAIADHNKSRTAILHLIEDVSSFQDDNIEALEEEADFTGIYPISIDRLQHTINETLEIWKAKNSKLENNDKALQREVTNLKENRDELMDQLKEVTQAKDRLRNYLDQRNEQYCILSQEHGVQEKDSHELVIQIQAQAATILELLFEYYTLWQRLEATSAQRDTLAQDRDNMQKVTAESLDELGNIIGGFTALETAYLENESEIVTLTERLQSLLQTNRGDKKLYNAKRSLALSRSQTKPYAKSVM